MIDWLVLLFRDIFPVLLKWDVFNDLNQVIIEHIKSNYPQVEAIVALESRGFLFGTHLSLELKIPFIPVRKSGKLPGKLLSGSYSLEYGKDSFELQSDSIKPGMKCIIFDDLIATGGSMNAAINLVKRSGGNVIECIVIMELLPLEGKKNIQGKLDIPLHSVVKYDWMY